MLVGCISTNVGCSVFVATEGCLFCSQRTECLVRLMRKDRRHRGYKGAPCTCYECNKGYDTQFLGASCNIAGNDRTKVMIATYGEI